MKKKNLQHDLHLLYQLSLSIGASLDLDKNCSNFCHSLMEQKNLSVASVWFQKKSKFVAKYAFPQVALKNKSLAIKEDFALDLDVKKYLVVSAKSKHFELLREESSIMKGTYLVFKLPQVGFVKFYTAQESRHFEDVECEQLLDLMYKFSNSILACRSYKKSVDENQRQLEIQRHLEVAREKAIEASRLKSLFFANMSHEIRTPLNAIIGFTNLLSKESLSLTQKNYAHQICTAGDNLLQMINEILDFSKIESGMMTSSKNPFNPKKVLDDVMDVLQPLATSQKVDLRLGEVHLPEGVLLGDEGQLSQVLINLGANAIKFSPKGEVRLNWSHQKTKEGVSTQNKIWISDNGIGIEESMLTSIFNAFEQADNSATREVGGSGLGLAITKGLLQSMGGEIYVKSKPGEGSTFTVQLPFELKGKTSAPVANLAPKKTKSKTPLKKKSILIVEDNKVNQLIAKAYVEQAGADVKLAENGLEAIDLIQSQTFDLVLMDCQMPEMDGYEATSQIRRMGYGSLPILALTAHAFNTDRERCLSVGMNDYLTKPISEDQLVQKIVFWLDQAADSYSVEEHKNTA